MSLFCRALVIWTVLAGPVWAASADPVLRKYHPWGRFSEGSWVKIRVTTETFDDKGNVVSSGSVETKTTLQEVDLDGVTLLVENTVEVAGKRLGSQPQLIRQGYAGEQIGQNVAIKNLGPSQVTIDGKQIPCEMQEVEVLGEGRKRVTLIHYSEAIAPHILRRKSTSSDLATKSPTAETTIDVLALDMPVKVVGEMHNGAYVKVVQKLDTSTTQTVSVNCADVPGEIVSHTSKTSDQQGRLVRRSTLEVVGYSVAPVDALSDGMRFRQRRRDRR